MSILPTSLDYTDKDFSTLRTRVFALIRSVFPLWTDQSTTNFGNLIVESFCWLVDVLNFNQDANALESRIATVTQRRNLLALVKLLAYSPPGAAAAVAEETFTGVGLVADVVIPAGTVIKTQSEEPVDFQLLSSVTLTIAQPVATAIVEHSKTFTESFIASGQPNQQIASGQIPYLDASSTITDGSGLWEQVDNFLDSASADRHFTLASDNNDRATATFGDGINGQLPSGTITWVYKTGGGTLGNVEATSINKIDATLVDVLSNTVTVLASNTDAAAGGAEREVSALTKIKAPASIRAPRTTVAREDYEIHALEVPGIVRALMLTTDEEPAISLNSGDLYAVPTDTGFGNIVLRQRIKDICTETFPNAATFTLTVQPPWYLDIGITAKVSFANGVNTNAKRSAVKQAIIASLQTYFAPTLAEGTPNPAIDFGMHLLASDGLPAGFLPLSDIIDAVRDTTGVRRVGPLAADFTITATTRRDGVADAVVLSAAHADAPILRKQFPRLDGDIIDAPNVVIIDADTGLTVT